MATQAYHKRDLYTEVTSRILAELQTGAVTTLARWLARNAYKSELRAMGRRPEYEEIGDGANAYFAKHREALIELAKAHPARRERQ